MVSLWAEGTIILSPIPEHQALDVTFLDSWEADGVSVSPGHWGRLDYFLSGRTLCASSIFNLPLRTESGKSLFEQTSSCDNKKCFLWCSLTMPPEPAGTWT